MVATTTPIWAQNLRDAGRQHFEVLGLPSTKAEPWRYFPTRAISKIAWASGGTAEGAGHGSLDQGALAAFALDDMAATVVLVDGRFSADLSSATTLPEGLVVTSLRAAIARDDAALRGVLGQVVDAEVDGLVAANQAQFADGVFVSVAKNVQVEAPLYVLSVTTQGSDETAISMRNVVSLGQSSSLTFAVRHVVLAGAMEKTKYVTNIVTEVQLAANAGLTHIKLEDEGEAAHHVEAFGANLGRDARLSSLVVSLGGLEARTAIRVKMLEPGGECALNGLYLGDGKQRLDHYTAIDHIAPHCSSSEYYAGILDGSSVGTFQGVVYFREGAVKSATEQLNRNLLLSDGAQANTKPQLEIDNDDVKAAHGSTVGQLDDAALFYLETRGIDPETARGLLTFAFAREVVEKVTHDGLRDLLVQRVAMTLGTTEMLALDGMGALEDEVDA